MTTEDVKDYLRKYRKLKKEERSLLAQLLEAKELAGGLKSPIITDMPKGAGGASDLSATMARIDAIERRWKATQDDLMNALAEISGTIDRVDDPQERTVIRMRYISGKSWQAIAFLMEKSLAWVYKVHDRALHSIADFLEVVE